MRYLTICLLGVAVLNTACQPHTPTFMKPTLAGPKKKVQGTDSTAKKGLATISSINSSHDNSQTEIAIIVEPTATQASKITPSINDSHDNRQTEAKLAVGDIPSKNNAKDRSEKQGPVIPRLVFVAPKVFNPTDIIGFVIPVLVRELGHATITRQEGPVEIWQYHFTNCIVDFYFYPINKPTQKLMAKSWDMRSTLIGKSLDRVACRAEMNVFNQNILTN